VPESIVGGTIFVGGLIAAIAAVGVNIAFVRYVVGPRRASAADRGARFTATLTFVDIALRFTVVAWVGLAILFLGLVFDGKSDWILAIPTIMLVWTAAADMYVKRLLKRAR
jgi:hypothetical protein